MCNNGLKHTLKSYSIPRVVNCILFVLIPIILFFNITVPTFSEVSDNTQTQQEKKIVSIEFAIDGLPVTDADILSDLMALTHINIDSDLSRHAVQRSVNAIYSLQKYSQVDVYVTYTQDGVVLKYELENVIHLQEVHISGIGSGEFRRAIGSAIKMKAGDKYVPIMAYDDINTIKEICADRGYFNVSVKIRTDADNDSLTYHITLGNPTIVKQFDIQGNSSIFTVHIKEVCNTHVGEVYNKSAVNEDIKAIQELYKKKYYPSTVVMPNFKHESGMLTLNVYEGKQLLLDFVDENGKAILQDTLLRKLLSLLDIDTRKSERDQLRRKIEPLINDRSRWVDIVQAHFEAKGYHGTEVEAKTLTNSPLHVEFTVKPGTRYIVSRVEFSGNEAFLDSELLREMEMKPVNFFSRRIRKRYFSELALERDRNRLEILYEKAGYRDVQIKSEVNKPNTNKQREGEVSIHFTIFEPYKEVIYRCLFQGNSVIDNTALYDALPSKPPKPNARLVQKNYESAILKAYQDRGYIYAKVKKIEYLHKMETPVFKIVGDFTESLNIGTLPKRLRDAFNQHSLPLAGTSIATTSIGKEWSIQDKDNSARYTLLQEKEQLSVYAHGILQFDIVEGDQIIFGKFDFVGDTGVIPDVLNREVAHLPGTLFTFDKLNLAIQTLYNTRIFEPGILPTPIPASVNDDQPSNIDANGTLVSSGPQPKVNDVSIRLQKRLPRAISADAGFSSSDGPRGTLDLSHLNLFKRNIRFRLRGRWGVRGYLYDTTLTEPWLIGRTSGSLQFLGRKLEEDDDVRALQGSFTLSRKLHGSHRLNLQYSYRFLTDTSIEEASVASLIPNPSTTVSSLSFLWRQDNRVPSLDPKSGMLNEVSVEYAGSVLGGESGFVKFISDTRYHRQLSSRGFVLATALRLGYTPGLQTNDNDERELISFERFWAGGSTTVRGYEERGLGPKDSTGKHRGNVQVIFNTEVSFPILNPIHGVLFFDTGNVWGTFDDIESKWPPASAGIGLRLKLGPLVGGIDYAKTLVSVPEVPTRSLYFRFGNTF